MALNVMRKDYLLSLLNELVSDLTGIDPAEINSGATFFELGADSLMLLNASQAIQDKFGLKIPFRTLLAEIPNLDSLADYLDRQLQPGEFPLPSAPSGSARDESRQESTSGKSSTPITEKSDGKLLDSSLPQPVAQQISDEPLGLFENKTSDKPEMDSASKTVLEDTIAKQMQLMSKQLDLLHKLYARSQPSPSPKGTDGAGVPAREEFSTANEGSRSPKHGGETPALPGIQSSLPNAKAIEPAVSQETNVKPSVAYQPVNKEATGELSPHQRMYLERFIARVVKRTQGSKQIAQEHRSCLADSRATSGFNLLWKQITYPLIVQRASGSRVWDVDGNEYVDIAMGFGALLFGHSPPFILEALHEQINHGIQLGLESNLAGKAAGLICDLTGVERVAFCNSGTDAVMTALRLARTATGRSKIALFEGSYHGTFDETLVRGVSGWDGRLIARPLCPGVPSHLTDEVLLLRFNSPESLDILKSHAHELAAVMVDPLQSCRPDMQPEKFLRELREFTAESGAVLIFDEMVTGFRFGPGGAQALFGVQADLVTYGKAMGGGLPAAAIAGKAAYMNAIDGGMWDYDDASYPRAETTFFAGTYFKHPLIMAGVWAALNHIRNTGSQLQEQLDQLTSRLARTLNAYFEESNLPIQVSQFGSLFRFPYPGSQMVMDAFYYHLLEKGVYICETRNCFLSTAHTDEDVDYVVRAVRESIAEMEEGGFFSEKSSDPAPTTKQFTCQQAGSLDNSKGLRSSGIAESNVALPTAQSPDGQFGPVITAPLTEAQEQLWLLAKMDEEASRAYNESLVLRLHGMFNLSALRNAVHKVIGRHEALRITFSPDGDYQQVCPALEIDIPLTDVSHIDDSTQRQELVNLIRTEKQQPFDLTHGPLLRARALRMDEYRHVLILTLHHIITDGWSNGILVQEVREIYEAECQGIECHLPEPMPFTAYARLMARQRGGPEMALAETYWLSQFAGTIPVLELPIDHHRPATQTFSGARKLDRIDTSEYLELKWFSAQQGCTLFMLLLAGFNTLLHRMAGQDDIVVGIASSGQLSAGSNSRLVGYCTKLLPVRSKLTGDMQFRDYLVYVKETLSGAYDNQSYPISLLIKKLNLPRDPGRAPLVTTAFNLDHDRSNASCDLDAAETACVSSKFDISLNVTERRDDLLLEWEYNTDLFESQTVRRWMAHFQTLMNGIVRNPDSQLSQIPLLEDIQRKQIIEDWNDTQADYSLDQLLHELFEAQADKAPDAVAVQCGPDSMTYRELNAGANRLAHYLRTLGVRTETRVALCMGRSLEALVGIVGILKSGGAYVPLNPDYPKKRLAFMLEDSRAVALVTRRHLLAGLPELNVPVVLLDNDCESMSQCADTNPERATGPDNLAYVIYTSGTTGKPKGVMVEHKNLANTLLASRCEFDFNSRDVMPCLAAFSFDISLFELFNPLIVGGTVRLADHDVLDVGRLVDGLDRMTCLHAVPSLMAEIVSRIKAQSVKQSFGNMRVVFTGGDLVPVELLRDLQDVFPHSEIKVLYGPTEATIICSSYEAPRGERIERHIIGKPLANTILRICDDNRNPVPIGVSGEIYVGGAGTTRGYLNREELNSERYLMMDGQRFYRTGDVGRYLADGNVEFLGRLDQQVKIHGYRIEPEEIESVLKGHPDVEDAAVVPVSDAFGDKRLAAYVVPRHSLQIDTRGPVREGRDHIELWPSIGEYFIYDDLIYDALTGDERRNTIYQTAFKQLLKDKVVVDIGTGRDAILARLCVEAGAKRVYAIEVLKEPCHLAKRCVQNLGLQDKITVIHGDSTRVELPEKVDACVSEIFEAIAGAEGAAVTINGARRLFKDNCVVIPQRATTRIAAISLPDVIAKDPKFTKVAGYHVDRIFEQVGYKFDLRLCVRNFPKSNIISDIGVFEDLDFSDFTQPEFNREAILTVNKTSRLDGFLLWLNMQMTEGVTLDILEEESSWYPVFFPVFYPGIDASEGDTIRAVCSATLSENAVNPDYVMEGELTKGSGEVINYEYESAHHKQSHRQTPFYTHLFRTGETPIQADGDPGAFLKDLKGYLKKSLPDYMLPRAFLLLDGLPLNEHGKLDRAALPAPDQQSALEAPFIAPRTPAEQALADIWANVLGVEQVGIHDDFFEMGGDSIQSIQIAARANAAGFQLTPKQLFQNHTIAALAGLVGTADAVETTERIPLTPIQRWFFEQELPDPHHFNHGYLVELSEQINVSLLESAVEFLLERHDALRLRFVRRDGEWQQFKAERESHNVFSVIDLSELSEQGKQHAMKAAAEQLHRSLNLTDGPLLRVSYFDMGDDLPPRLLLVIHHLAVDTMSWRILLQDLRSAYEQLSQGSEIELTPGTSSFEEWAKSLSKHVKSGVLSAQMNHWLGLAAIPRTQLPSDKPGGDNTVSSARRIFVSLDKADTGVLQSLAKMHNMQVSEALLAALADAFGKWTGEKSLLIDIEGHGRESILENLNTSRTVGWFTAIYPVLLDLARTQQPSDILECVKQELRKIPNGGIAYGLLRYLNNPSFAKQLRDLPRPEVSFNYLNESSSFTESTSNAEASDEKSGTSSSVSGLSCNPRARRYYLVEVSAVLAENRLGIEFTYSQNVHRRATIEALARGLLNTLRMLTAQAQTAEAAKHAASDLNAFGWGRADIADITAAIKKSRGQL